MLVRRYSTFLAIFAVLMFCLIAISPSISAKLIAHWPMDENSGEIVKDVVGGHNGKFAGGNIKWVKAKFGNGLYFDSSKAYVEVPKTPDLELSKSLTVVAWVNFEVASGRREVVSYADSYIINLGDGVFNAYIYQGNWPRVRGKTTVNAGEWYFVALTYDSSDLSLYVNGELDSSSPLPGGIKFQDFSLWFGGPPADAATDWYLIGTMDEVEIYDNALTKDEIKSIYKSPPVMAVFPKDKLAVQWGKLKAY